MIRSHPFAVALISLIFLLALCCAWCAGWWLLGVRELQLLKNRYQAMNQTSTAVQALANEAIEYGRRNPSMEPLLRQFEVIPPRGPQSPQAPPANPTPSRTGGR